jgi:hypothetical protein
MGERCEGTDSAKQQGLQMVACLQLAVFAHFFCQSGAAVATVDQLSYTPQVPVMNPAVMLRGQVTVGNAGSITRSPAPLSMSKILTVPFVAPAATWSSLALNITHSTGAFTPIKLCKH